VIEFYYGEQPPSPSSPIRITDLAWLGRGYISGKGRNKYVPKLDAAAAAAAAAPHSVAGIAALVSAVLFLDSGQCSKLYCHVSRRPRSSTQSSRKAAYAKDLIKPSRAPRVRNRKGPILEISILISLYSIVSPSTPLALSKSVR
jgi:hypothetical protein